MKAYQPSDDVVAANDAIATTVAGSLTKVKEIQLTASIVPSSKFRFKFDQTNSAGANGTCRVYRNGSAIGTSYANSASWVTSSEDINATNWYPGDLIQLYASAAGGGTTSVRNFRLCGVMSDWKVNL